MRKFTLALAFLLSAYAPVLIAEPAPAHRVPVWKRVTLYSLVAVTNSIDAETTIWGIDHGMTELNPALKQIVHHRNLWRGFKLSISVWNIVEAERSYRRGNSQWWVTPVIEGSAGLAANAWNVRQIRIHNDKTKRKLVLP